MRGFDVLTYTSAPLSSPLTIAGAVAAELYVESDAVDFDLDVVLSIVGPDDRVLNLVQGYSRVGARAPPGPSGCLCGPRSRPCRPARGCA